MTALTDRIMQLLHGLIALCLALMVVLVFGNVALRYLFNTGILVSEELSRMLFVWLVFLGAIIAMRENAHLGVDILVKRLPPLGKKICLVVAHLLVLLALGMFIKGAWLQTQINLANRAPVTGLPVAVIHLAGLVCAVAMTLMMLVDLWRVATGRISERELVQVSEAPDLAEVEEIRHELEEQRRH
jgi:TRAP-type C4-dicarboxylate transport system permease small subunit